MTCSRCVSKPSSFIRTYLYGLLLNYLYDVSGIPKSIYASSNVLYICFNSDTIYEMEEICFSCRHVHPGCTSRDRSNCILSACAGCPFLLYIYVTVYWSLTLLLDSMSRIHIHTQLWFHQHMIQSG